MRLKHKVMLLFLLLLLIGGSVFAGNEVTVVVNGQPIVNDSLIIINGNQPYVSVSEISSKFGAQVTWLDVAELAVVNYEEKYISFSADEKEMTINNEITEMEGPSVIFNNRIYAPLKSMMDIFPAEYEYDEMTITLKINSERIVIEEAEKITLNYTEEDVMWLARIVEVEGRGSSLEKRLAVANVVLNRVASPSFPATIFEVIFQAGKAIQFPPAHKESFYTLVPTYTSIVAAKKALHGDNNIETCLYFNNRPFKNKSTDLHRVIEGEYFYY